MCSVILNCFESNKIHRSRNIFSYINCFHIMWVGLFLMLNFVATVRTDDNELIFVSVVFRHGNRAPLKHYKTDPYKNEFPDGPGQLTKRGKLNMYNKGKILRKMYKNFISEIYSENELYCTSTKKDRTHMSAQLVLAGMYPPEDSYHHFDSNLFWQPIPVHEDSPDKSTDVFDKRYLCPRNFVIYKEELNKTSQLLLEQDSNILDYCGKHIGEKLETFGDLAVLVDALKTEVADGFKLPEWANSLYSPIMLSYYATVINDAIRTTTQKRIVIGPLLKQIIENMVKKSSNKLKPDRKMILYSGHDFSILGLLGAIMKNQNLPHTNFGASLSFELYRSVDDNFIIKIKYLKSFDDEDPEEISIPDCGNPCTLTRFIQLTQYVIPNDWDLECRVEQK